MDIINDPRTPLSQPVGGIRELLVPEEAAIRVLRANIASWLGGTEQGRLLDGLPDDVLLSYCARDHSPIPASRDREGYCGDNHIAYWLMGLGDYLFLENLLGENITAETSATSLLDFGCASGRVLRHFTANSPYCVFGCDINPNNIAFIRTYLSSAIVGFLNTTIPPLPLPDQSLNFVYAGSVFTHIDHFEEAWLLEIRRILAPDGVAFITFHSERTWNQINENHFIYQFFASSPHRMQNLDLTESDFDGSVFENRMPSQRVTFIRTDYNVNNVNTFHSTDYIRQRWGKIFEVRGFRQNVHGHHQDGVILRKYPGWG